MSFFQNWGNWSADPDRNDALNQAVTLFGANMLAGAGSGRNLSSIMGRAVGAGVEGFNDTQDRQMKRRYMDAQIEDQRSQAEYRKGQLAEMQRKAQLAQQILQARQSILNPSPTDAALRTQSRAGLAGPTQQAATLAQQYANNGYQPTPDDLRTLASIGALESTDVSMFNTFKPDSHAAGNYLRSPDGRLTHLPDPTKGVTIGPTGGVQMMPGAENAQRGLSFATEAGKQDAETAFAFPKSAAKAAGEAAFAPPIESYDPSSGARFGVPRFQYGMAQLPPGAFPLTGGQPAPGGGTQPQARGGAPMAGPTVPPAGPLQLGPGRADTRADTTVKDADVAWRKSADETIAAGGNAKMQLAQYRAVRALQARTGWGEQTLSTFANVLTSLGVNSETVRRLASDSQAFGSFMNRFVADYQLLQKGPQTESDARRYEAMMPSLRNTEEANAFLLDYMEAVATLQAKKADFYSASDRLLRERRVTSEEIDRAWMERNDSIWDQPTMGSWRQLEATRRGAATAGAR